MNLVRATVRVFLSRAAGRAVAFLGLTAFARLLGADAMGTFFLFQALLGILAVPADLGINTALEKRLSGEGSAGDVAPGAVLSSAALLRFGLVTAVSLVVLIVAPWIDGYVGARVAPALVVGLYLQGGLRTVAAGLRGERRVDEAAAVDALGRVLWILVGGALVALSYGVRGVVAGLLVGYGVATVVGYHRLRTAPGRPSRSVAASSVDFSKYSAVSSVGGKVYSWTDVVVIGAVLPAAAVGAYEMAWRVTAVVLLFSRAVATTVFPQISSWEADNEGADRIGDLVGRALTPSLFFVVPALFGVAVLADPILTVAFGADYGVAALAFSILMVETVFRAAQVVFHRALEAVDRPDLAARAMVVAIVLNVATNVALVPAFGLPGAAVATTGSFATAALLQYRSLSSLVAFDLPTAELGGSLLAAAGMGAVLVGLREVIAVDDPVTLALAVGTGVVVYGTLALATPALRWRMRDGARTLLDSGPDAEAETETEAGG